MLRIDETSRTLVATEPPALVPEPAPARDELLGLLGTGWELFAAEIGQPHLRFLAAEPAEGADLLAFDATTGRVALVAVADDLTAEAVGRALAAAATVAGWDAARLAAVHEDLEVAVPHDSAQVVLVAGTAGEGALALLDFLASRHGLDLGAHVVRTLRLGSERLMEVTRAHPAADEAAAPEAPAFHAGIATTAPAPGASTPPPGVAAA